MHWVKAFTSLHFLSWGVKWPSTQFFWIRQRKIPKQKHKINLTFMMLSLITTELALHLAYWQMGICKHSNTHICPHLRKSSNVMIQCDDLN